MGGDELIPNAVDEPTTVSAYKPVSVCGPVVSIPESWGRGAQFESLATNFFAIFREQEARQDRLGGVRGAEGLPGAAPDGCFRLGDRQAVWPSG